MVALGWVVCGGVASLLANFILSLIAFRRLDRAQPVARPDVAWPRISVLIPARDEAATIGACVTSLLAQSYPHLEILVLDDESQDGTGAIVARLTEGDFQQRLHLVPGQPLAPGWLGKCHACAQLAAAATGDYLIFTDADTVHGPHSVENALAAMERGHLGLLSVLPRQRAQTFAERLLMPLLPLNILMLLPVGLVARRPEPSLSAGVGQFLAFRRATYQQIGGHEAVRAQVLDDVQLARRAKANGWRTDLWDGAGAVQCRMYSSLGAIWRGFSKNQYDFYGRSAVITLLAVAMQALCFVAPPLVWLAALVARWPISVAIPWAVATGLGISMRLVLLGRVGAPGNDWRTPAAWAGAALHSVAVAIQCAITLNSWQRGRRGMLDWKGRHYAALTTPRQVNQEHKSPPNGGSTSELRP